MAAPALYRAHQVLIAAAMAMGALLGVWGIWEHGRSGRDVSLWVGVAGLVAAVGLGAYLRRFRQRQGGKTP